MSLKPVYVEVELSDSEDNPGPTFVISPAPFVMLHGEYLSPTTTAESYSQLCLILRQDFQIPEDLIPPENYFGPTSDESEAEAYAIYRTVPEGMGEPEWRTDVRNAVIQALEEADFFSDRAKISMDGNHYYSLEELQLELEDIAEAAGGKTRISGEPYQPDYDVLVKEIIANYSAFIRHNGLPRRTKKKG